MAKTVTLRLDESIYEKIKYHAEQDHRPLSNYIETATLRYMEDIEDHADQFEMESIKKDKGLINSLKLGSKDAKNKKGRFFEHL